MNIIKEHDVRLHGRLRELHDIRLIPLSDEHLHFLYKWNADVEVMCWEDGPSTEGYDEEEVHEIYEAASSSGYSFLIEFENNGIGECLLCKMGLDYVLKHYPDTTDVRRVDILIGEKEFWNKGIGSKVTEMLMNFAFYEENVDVLYGITKDFNKRSAHMLKKNGFTLFEQFTFQEEDEETETELHFRITKAEYAKKFGPTHEPRSALPGKAEMKISVAQEVY